MRILITGGFGFVGGRLADHFSQVGHQVVLASRNESNPPDWLPQAEVTLIKYNDDNFINNICEGVDVIIHAAGMNAQDCAADPVAALDFNGVATARLVEGASRAGVKKFIYLSTAHIYSSPLVGIITEETFPSNLHPYATSHLAGEHAVLSASKRGEIKGIVLRLSNAFGSPMHKDVNCWMLLVNDLCRQAVVMRKLVLKTNGLHQRDFVCMTEVCRVAEYLVVGDGASTKLSIFNVGAGISQSVLEMAHLIKQRCTQVLDFEPKLHHKQGGVDEQLLTLTYRTDSLNSLGISSKSQDNIEEIDSLLQFCQLVFTQKQSENT
ncbi:MAG: SDR family oxidoreductase [Pseudomonadota bacterium]|nr:SDR family oxidoreductase [Pseudomonadota bacterium]